MNRRRITSVFSLLFFTLCLAACSSTTLTGSSRNQQYTGGPGKKVMVVGVAQNEQIRRIFEDEFARQLKEAGVQATQSYGFYMVEQLRDKAQRPQIQAKLKELGYDEVIVTRLVGRRTETVRLPGTAVGPTSYGRGEIIDISGGWSDYYQHSAALVDEPGTAQYDLANLECKLFAVDTAMPIWTGNLETQLTGKPVTPESSKALIPPFVEVVVKDLKKEGLI